MSDYRGSERRSGIPEEDAKRIAKMAAKEALAEVYQETLDNIYADLGRGVFKAGLVAIGTFIMGGLAYAKAKGWW